MTKNQIKRLRKNTITKIREKKEKEKKKKESKIGEILKGKPQIKGITVKIYTLTPKKPNSALRKVAKVKVYIPIRDKKEKERIITERTGGGLVSLKQVSTNQQGGEGTITGGNQEERKKKGGIVPKKLEMEIAPLKIEQEKNVKSKQALNNGIEKRRSKIIIAYIPKEKHSLTIHNMVLIKPGKTKDLPGVRYKVIRGALDCK